jgi:hypothetical protein
MVMVMGHLTPRPWAGRFGPYQAGSRLSDPGMGPVNRRWVLGGSGVKVVGVWTPNTGPRTVIIAVPWVFTQYTAVEAASVPDRFWYRTRMSFPVRTENSVIERLGVSRWLGGAERC